MCGVRAVWLACASATGYVPDTLKYGIRYGTDYGAIPYPYMCGFVFRDAGGPVTRALGFFVLSSTVAVKRVGCTRRTFIHFTSHASKALGQYILVVSQRAKWRASVP